eukprot:8760920-Pyramimonas_sp.AAC.1
MHCNVLRASAKATLCEKRPLVSQNTVLSHTVCLPLSGGYLRDIDSAYQLSLQDAIFKTDAPLEGFRRDALI